MVYDFIVVGAGIVGLSTAYRLQQQYEDASILVLEKEKRVAAHQTGNNSGVIHSGIYYKPGSYKAKNCVDGRHQLVDFCQQYGVDYEICGKVVVASEDDEDPERLHEIYRTGLINNIEGIKLIDRKQALEIEPYIKNCVEAIWVPCSGIVDYIGVCEKLHDLIKDAGNRVIFNSEVVKIKSKYPQITTVTKKRTFTGKYLINCTGLYTDQVARLAGLKPDIQIVPFRGEYYKLTAEAKHMVNGLIYPLPNPAFPFLGVHFTSMVNGDVECGPNAVFAFKREGYKRISFDLQDTVETVNFPGFWNMAKKHWKMGVDEYYRSFSKRAFLKNLQKLIPAIQSNHLVNSPSGVRAMALEKNGEIVDDFRFERTENQIHVLNAPSPAATAGLAIGEEIVKKVNASFEIST